MWKQSTSHLGSRYQHRQGWKCRKLKEEAKREKAENLPVPESLLIIDCIFKFIKLKIKLSIYLWLTLGYIKEMYKITRLALRNLFIIKKSLCRFST